MLDKHAKVCKGCHGKWALTTTNKQIGCNLLVHGCKLNPKP